MGADAAAEEQFGPYLVYERLGVGGMATVHRALERGIEGFERVVALKRLLPHLAADASFIKAFVREAKLASYLKHVNIVQLFELGRVGTVYFISMEYIDGRDIRRILRQARKVSGPPPIHVSVGLLLQLCDALDYAHTKVDDDGRPLGIVHRDVSPSNVLVTTTGQIKVIDFGIAKAQSAQLRTQTGRVKGKLAYMAPEVLAGKELDARSDLFAVGVIAHELLTARPLFATKNEYQTLMKVQRGDVVPPSTFNQGCPPELDAIVMRALAREPDDRFCDAANLRDALHALRKQYQLQTSERDIVTWLDWAFRLEAPSGGFTVNHELDPASGMFDVRPSRPRMSAPKRNEDDDVSELAWGDGEELSNGQPVLLDDVPDVSGKHLSSASALGAEVLLDLDDLADDLPSPLPSRPSRAALDHSRPSRVALDPSRVALDPSRASRTALDPSRPSRAALDPSRPSRVALDPSRPSRAALDPSRPSRAALDPSRAALDPSRAALDPSRPTPSAPAPAVRTSQAVPVITAAREPSQPISEPPGAAVVSAAVGAGVRSVMIPPRVRTITSPPRIVPSGSTAPRTAPSLAPLGPASDRTVTPVHGVPALRGAPSTSTHPLPATGATQDSAADGSAPHSVAAKATSTHALPPQQGGPAKPTSTHALPPQQGVAAKATSTHALPAMAHGVAPSQTATHRAPMPATSSLPATGSAPHSMPSPHAPQATPVPRGVPPTWPPPRGFAAASTPPPRERQHTPGPGATLPRLETKTTESASPFVTSDDPDPFSSERTPMFTVEDLAGDTVPSMPALPSDEPIVRFNAAAPAKPETFPAPTRAVTPATDLFTRPPPAADDAFASVNDAFASVDDAFAAPGDAPSAPIITSASNPPVAAVQVTPAATRPRGVQLRGLILVLVAALVFAGAAALVAARYLVPADDAPAVLPQPPLSRSTPVNKVLSRVVFALVPVEAAITIDGKPVHAGSPWQADLSPGVHQIEIHRDGYKGWLTSIDLAIGEVQTLRVELEPLGPAIAADATLILGSTPAALEVVLDGAPLAARTPLRMAIKPGPHTLVLRKNGVDVWKKELDARGSAVYEYTPTIAGESTAAAAPPAEPPASDDHAPAATTPRADPDPAAERPAPGSAAAPPETAVRP